MSRPKHLDAVILYGGLGTRLREETEFRPKPMFETGGRPIMWHIMKQYQHFGVRNLIVCLGYRGEVICDYFLSYKDHYSDMASDFAADKVEMLSNGFDEDWRVVLVDTGADPLTGTRIKRALKYVRGDTFFATYGDGVSDVDIDRLLAHHLKAGMLSTVTAVHPSSRYGEFDIAGNAVALFREKPQVTEGWINGGFFVFNTKVFDRVPFRPQCDPGTVSARIAGRRQAARGLQESRLLAVHGHVPRDAAAEPDVGERRHPVARMAGMSAVGLDPDFWRGCRVFLTGHTGFMGGWLSLWLARLGAEVTGLALDRATKPNLFEAAGVAKDVRSIIADIRDLDRVAAAVEACRPEIVLHLAAQPLVRAAHADPVTNYQTNVIGTVHLLQALRQADGVQAAVIVTTDKVYANREWCWGYREGDRLGGREPYGTSKACAELVVEAFEHSYFAGSGRMLGIATIRAGNVIGGGDWADDRLVPDAVRAFATGETLTLRNPDAVRPWQHVLEPLSGMLMLAQGLCDAPDRFSGPWNLGPDEPDIRSVAWVVGELGRLWGGGAGARSGTSTGPYEAKLLSLSSAKAKAELGWRPLWSIETALVRCTDWYRTHLDGGDARDLSLQQIAEAQDGRTARPACPDGAAGESAKAGQPNKEPIRERVAQGA